MVAKLVLRERTFSAFRAAILGIFGFVGVWDVSRLMSAGDRAPSTFDLLTCPMVAVARLLATYINISDGLLAAVLFLGNAATYAALGYMLLRLIEHRFLGSQQHIPES